MLPHIIVLAIGLITVGLISSIVVLMLLTKTDQIMDKIVEPEVSSEDRYSYSGTAGIYIRGILVSLIFLVWGYYFLCVAYSYYKEILEEGDRTSSPTTSIMHSATQRQPSEQSQPKSMVTLNLQTQASYLAQSAADHENLWSVFSPSVANRGSSIRTIPIWKGDIDEIKEIFNCHSPYGLIFDQIQQPIKKFLYQCNIK